MSDANGVNLGAPVIHENGPSAVDAGRGGGMPPAPPAPRMRPSDFRKQRGNGELAAGQRERAQSSQAPAPQQTARQHIGEFDRALQARQGQEQPENVHPSLRKEPEAPPATPELEPGAAPSEAQPDEATADSTPVEFADAEALAKYREWEKSDLFPDELLGKFHPVKVRGEERYVDTEELRKGYIRYSDYQERGKELKTREESTAKYRQTMEQHFEAIKDPNTFLNLYEQNGYGDQLMQVATMLAKRQADDRSIVQAHGLATARRLGYTQEQIDSGAADRDREVVAAMDRAHEQLQNNRRTEVENRRLAHERERFESDKKAAAHAQEVAKHQEQYSRQIGQLRPLAFRAHGIEDSAQNREKFIAHLQEVVEASGGITRDGFTRDQVMNAAQLMREREQDKQARLSGNGAPAHMSPDEWRVAQQAQARRGGLPPGRTSTGAGRQVVPPGTQAKRPSDFQRERRERYFGK